MDKRRERKEKHIEQIVTRILKAFVHMDVRLDSYQISVIGIEGIQDQDLFRYANQHLKSYPQISINWQLTNRLIESLNRKLTRLYYFVSNKALEEFGNNYKNEMLDTLWDIIKRILKGNIANIESVDINVLEVDDTRIQVSFGKNYGGVWLPNKEYELDKIKQFLIQMLQTNEFRNNIIRTQGEYDRLIESNERIRIGLHQLIDDIENSGEDLRGKCSKCSWVVRMQDSVTSAEHE